jgi:ubiquinol-cytochrome c reductase cytochrome b subunit
MSAAHDWLDERVDLKGLRAALLDRLVPDRLTWWHTLGSATLTVLALQVVTGIVLATYYSPSPDHAYDSVRYIQHTIAMGALLRGMHFWGANAMIVLLIAHVVRVFSMGSYKYPREANWMVGVGLFLLVMGMGFTGYLLPWDQKAYWATAVGTNIPGTVPVVGEFIVHLLRAGSKLGAATLTRFYAVHVLLLPLLIGLLVLVHLALVVRNGIAPRATELEEGAPARTSDPGYGSFYRRVYEASKRGGHRFWPDVIGKDALVAGVVVVAIVALAAWRGAPLTTPADPTAAAYHPRPEWYFLPLYELLRLTPGSLESFVAVGVPAALVLAMLALPLFDRRSTRSLLHRPVSAVVLVGLLGGSGALIGIALEQVPPHVPPEVGHPLSAIQEQGRALFRTQGCLSCHAIDGEGGKVGPDLAKMKIGLLHSEGWIHSFIENPARFHPHSFMPGFAPPAMTHQEIDAIAQYLSALRGGEATTITPQYQDTFPGPGGPELHPPGASSPGTPSASGTARARTGSTRHSAAGETAMKTSSKLVAAVAASSLAVAGSATAREAPAASTPPSSAAPASAPSGVATALALPSGDSTVTITEAMIEAGRKLFHGAGMCQACHGPDLKGTAMAPDLEDQTWKNGDGSYDDILKIILGGVSGTAMQADPGGLSDQQAREVAGYVWAVSHGKAKP